jgi:hypothetical protein
VISNDQFFEYVNPHYFIIAVGDRSAQLGFDIGIHGASTFTVSLLGGFKTEYEALFYRRWKLNNALDVGKTTYNNEIIDGNMTRVMSVVVPYKLSVKLLDYCNTIAMPFGNGKFFQKLLKKHFRGLNGK